MLFNCCVFCRFFYLAKLAAYTRFNEYYLYRGKTKTEHINGIIGKKFQSTAESSETKDSEKNV
jgi:hypothetical protein